MKDKKKILIILFIGLLFNILLLLVSTQQELIDGYYGSVIYPVCSEKFRMLSGFFRFSVGDLLYLFSIIFLIWRVTRFFFRLKSGSDSTSWSKRLIQTLIVILFIHVLFQIFWGLNYSRKGIEQEMGLTFAQKNTALLKKVNEVLLHKLNEARSGIKEERISFPNSNLLFEGAANSYSQYATKHEFLSYSHPSIKATLWGWLGSYAGFSGYYNPFTGEAQINMQIPDFTKPYVTCHEMAHQLGYAKEMDANFAAFLVCREASDVYFRYSAYLEMFLYANRSLHQEDSAQAQKIRQQLSPMVRSDLLILRQFNKDHQSFLEPVFEFFFDLFLKSNKQKNGIKSYNQVTRFLIAYYSKYGEL